MKRILGLLSALLLSVSYLFPLSVISVNAEEYGWFKADTDYFRPAGHSGTPDAIRIELAYTAGMHAYSDETVFGDPQHYAYHSETITLQKDVPYTWNVGMLYIDCWDYYDPEFYTQSFDHTSGDVFVSWDEYPDEYADLVISHPANSKGSAGWEVSRRIYTGTIDFTFDGRLAFDSNLTLSGTQHYTISEDQRYISNQGYGLERPYKDDPLIYVYSDHQLVDIYFRLLEVHYSETEAKPAVTPTVIHTDAAPESGERGFSIPAAIAGALGLGGALIYLARRNRNKTPRQKRNQETEEEFDDEIPKFEMRVYKEFGDRICAGDTKAVYAKIVKIEKDGTETDQDEYTRMIRVQAGKFLKVRKQEYMDHWMAAAVYAPLSNDVPSYGNIIFNFRNLMKVDMRFRLAGCIIVTDPATGAETVYHETSKGYWVSVDGSRVLDPERTAEWMEQRKRDREYIDKQNIKLEQGKTAFDRELAKIKQEYLDEAARIDEETKKSLYNLKKYGMTEVSDEYKRAVAERNIRLAEIEGAAAQRRAAIYHTLYYGAYATKFATDKAFDVIAKTGTAGKVGKALYTIAVDQTGAITEAVIEGKSGKQIAKEMLKAGMDSGLSIAKDYVDHPVAKYVTIVGGNTATAMGKAMVDGKRGTKVLTEGLVGGAKGTFEYVVDQTGDNLKKLIGADDTELILDAKGNVMQLVVDEKDVIVNSMGDLANGVYETAEQEMDSWIEQHKR